MQIDKKVNFMVSTADILNARILIVDDQEANVRLLEQMLREAGYQSLTSTMDPYAVGALHRANHYDLILLDLQMPGMDGFQVMDGLKEIDPDGYVPILVITAQPGHKLRALASGAKDFVAKPFDLVEVKTRIHNMLEVRLLYKQLEDSNRAMESLALHDPLTGLPNRRLLLDRLSLAIAHAHRNKGTMAVMYLDLDGFKQINDTLGHHVGDQLLQVVAQRLTTCVREDDTVARLGGDEFTVILESLANTGDVPHVAQKIIDSLSRPMLLDGHEITVTVSVGISLYPADSEQSDDLIKYADTAMYLAKKVGRNNFQFFIASMKEQEPPRRDADA